MNHSVGTDRLTTGQIDVIAKPRIIRAAPVVVYLHSNAGSATEAVGGDFLLSIQSKLAALAERGYTVVAPTSPITGWGSGTVASGGHATTQERLDDAIAYHRANLQGTNAPYVLVGSSGGSCTALRRCGLDPTNVACVATFLTVGCLTVVRSADIGGNSAAVGTAYGVGAYPAALPAQSDPAHQLSDTVPKLLTHGDSDAYSTTSGHVLGTDDYASSRGATFISVAGGVHDDSSVVGVSTSTFVDFIVAHAPL